MLRSKELNKIQNEMDSARLTLIPLEIFTQKRLLKVKIGLAKGKRKYEKRELIKKRDIERKVLRKENYF